MEKSTQAESQNPSLSLASISPATHVQINSACHLRKNIEIINLSQILFMSTVCCQFNCKIFQDRHRFKIPLSVFQMSSLQLYQISPMQVHLCGSWSMLNLGDMLWGYILWICILWWMQLVKRSHDINYFLTSRHIEMMAHCTTLLKCN